MTHGYWRNPSTPREQAERATLLTEKLLLDVDNLGYMVGVKGARIRLIRSNTGASVSYIEDPANSGIFYAVVQGTKQQVAAAKTAIHADVLEYHRCTKRVKGKSSMFGDGDSHTHPYTATLQLPPGGTRFYTGPGYQSILEIAAPQSVLLSFDHQDHIILKAREEDALNRTIDKLTEVFRAFISLAIPIPNWAIGRVLGRKGETLAKISDVVQMKTDSRLLCFIPNTSKDAGLTSYLVVLCDDRAAIKMAMQMILSRVVSITTEAGLFVSVLGSENIYAIPVHSTTASFSGLGTPNQPTRKAIDTSMYPLASIQTEYYVNQAYGASGAISAAQWEDSAMKHARHFSTAGELPSPYHSLQRQEVVHRRLNSFAPNKTAGSAHYDNQPQSLLRLLFSDSPRTSASGAASNGYCCVKTRSLLPLPKFLSTPFLPEMKQPSTVAVDKKHLVICAPEQCHVSPEFWQSSLLSAVAAIGRDFFFVDDSALATELMSQAFDFSVTCSPGRGYYAAQGDVVPNNVYEMSDMFNNRKLTVCFEHGVDEKDHNAMLADAQVSYMWYLKELLCIDISEALPRVLQKHLPSEKQVDGVRNGYSMWHSISFDRLVQLPTKDRSKQSGEEIATVLGAQSAPDITTGDISHLQDTEYDPIVTVNGIGISYVLHCAGGYDLSVKIGLVPRSVVSLLNATDDTSLDTLCQNNARLVLVNKYIKRFKERQSCMAFTVPTATSKHKPVLAAESPQFGEAPVPVQTYVAMLNMAELASDDDFHKDSRRLSLQELESSTGYSMTAGLNSVALHSKFPVSSTVIIQDHSAATLSRITFKVVKNVVVSSVCVQEFPAVAKSRLQLDFKPLGNYRWEAKGFAPRLYSFDELKTTLPAFVGEVKGILGSLPA